MLEPLTTICARPWIAVLERRAGTVRDFTVSSMFRCCSPLGPVSARYSATLEPPFNLPPQLLMSPPIKVGEEEEEGDYAEKDISHFLGFFGFFGSLWCLGFSTMGSGSSGEYLPLVKKGCSTPLPLPTHHHHRSSHLQTHPLSSVPRGGLGL